LISSLIIYLCGFVAFFKYYMENIHSKKEEKAKLAAEKAENGGKK
jgi:hypothetical protein